MKRLKVSDNFFLDEFVHPDAFIDARLVDIAQFIRNKLGVAITINNWFTGGQFKESGLRDKNTTTGSKLSQHKIGMAIDVKIAGFDGRKWHEFVKANAKELFELGARRIEDFTLATTWLHIDLKEHNKKCIQVVDLTKVVREIPV